jgi:hypothetical protein
MALSVLASPQYQAAYLPDYFTISESSGGIYTDPNFKFIAVLKNSSGTQLAKLRFPIYPNSTNKGVVNVSRILEAQVSSFFSDDSTSIGTSTTPIFEYEVEFGKEYGTPVTEYLNEASSTLITTIATTSDDVSFDWLTPVRTRNLHRNELTWLYWNNATGVTPLTDNRVQIKAYNAAGSVIQTTQLTYTPTAKTQFRVPLGANQYDFTSTGSIGSGGVPFVTSNAAYFTVEVGLWDGVSVFTPSSTTMRYNLVDTCSQYDSYTVCWLNERGGFDSWYFDMVRKDSYEIDRRTMKRDTYELNGNRFARNAHKHSKLAYYTETKQKAILNSNNLSTADSDFLKGLYTSPEVYLLDGSDYYPINITQNNYDKQYNNVDGVFNLKLEIEFSEPVRSQGI